MTTSATDRRANALRKIRACLRLSKSSNPHEAAAALRQAQRLMAEHGVGEADVELEAVDAPTRSRGGESPARIWLLACAVGDAFACTPVEARGIGVTAIRFVGREGSPEVASYAFAVLRRQLEHDVMRHTRRVRKRSNKAKRAEAFGRGWVFALSVALGRRDLPAAERESHLKFAGATSSAIIPAAGGGMADIAAGFAAGRQAKVNPGIRGHTPKLLESGT